MNTSTKPDLELPLAAQEPQAERSVAVRQEGAIQEGPANLLSALVDMARDPSVKPETVAAFIAMQERLEDRQAEREFNQAFIRLQNVLPKIKKNGTLEYPVDKNKPDGLKKKIANFVRWEDLDDAIRPLLNAEGFALSFNTSPRQGDGGGLLVTAILRHVAGHATQTSIPVPLDTSGGKNNLQGYGSSLSYGKRYAATAALNIIAEGEDDSGVRGGMKFITEAEAEELRTLATAVGQQEGSFLDQLFAGAVRSFDEIEAGPGYLACRSTLEAMKRRNEKRATRGAA